MLKEINIQNYRSFGGEGVAIKNLSKINIFIGKNNCGKSNILRFFNYLGKCKNLHSSNPLPQKLELLDYFASNKNIAINFSVVFDLPDGFDKEIYAPIELNNFYAKYKLNYADNGTRVEYLEDNIDSIEEPIIRQYCQKLGTTGGGFAERQKQVRGKIQIDKKINFSNIQYLDEFRRLSANDELKKELYQLVNYDHTQTANKEKLNKLNSFISDILQEEINIRIPSPEKEIELIAERGERHLPLSSYGAGIQQLILLGMYISVLDGQIFCIDEPELYMHPGIQRSFLSFISHNSNNQYFLTTHSSSFLDFEVDNKSIYHTKMIGGVTKIEECKHISAINNALNDLGIRASEILQTNGIIWVEGASDRVYIKKWLSLIEPELKEGFHYSFQYYGGKNLSHYSIADDDFEELINMLLINKNSYVVMDSDMTKKYTEADLRDTKQRVIKECKEADILYWVTEGREIENYLSNKLLGDLSGATVKRNKFQRVESYCNNFNPNKKVEFSKKAVNLMDESELKENLDLEKKISELILSINKWNNL